MGQTLGVVWACCDTAGTAARARGHEGRLVTGTALTRCLQPASLKGHSSMAVLQLSLRWVGTSSRAMLGVPHWLGHGTGYRGHWYWWFWESTEAGSQLGLGAGRVRVPVGSTSPGWCQRRTPWSSRCRAGCAWGTRPGRAGTAGAASCGPHTCSHSTHSPGDTCPGGPGDHDSVITLWLPSPASPDRDEDTQCPHSQRAQ